MIDKNYLKIGFNFLLCLIILSCSPNIETAPKGMVWIPGGTFYQGALESDSYAMNHEKMNNSVTIKAPIANSNGKKLVLSIKFVFIFIVGIEPQKKIRKQGDSKSV